MINKTSITIPQGIRYIGDWDEFNFSKFPEKCIINKELPGCGFTEYCIRSYENVILCSPRKMLLQNKFDQHPEEVYLVRNELEQPTEIDKDIQPIKENNRTPIKIVTPNDPSKSEITLVTSRIKKEICQYLNSHLSKAKILVTYDSFRIVKEILEELGIFQRFYVVIDEFQSILQDSRFKSSTEIDFLYHLQRSHSALFVSATPMLDKYIDMLQEFAGLPYFELDWGTTDISRIVKPDLKVLAMTSVGTAISTVITRFLSGQYDKVTVKRGESYVEVEAREIVLYVNSVDRIITTIKKLGLNPDQVNILCSNTEQNQNKINKKLTKKAGYLIGSVPLPGEPRKPITFCTRTVYLGADFYSDCAKSYVFSDSNLDCLSVDISLDLPQILGRQRLSDNPWKNQATLFYKTTADYRKMTKADFDAVIQKKTASTNKSLFNYNNVVYKEEYIADKIIVINADHYSRNYVALNRTGIDSNGEMTLVPVFNNLVRVSEIMAFDIQQIDYADRFSVFTSLNQSLGANVNGGTQVSDEVTQFFVNYDSMTRLSDKTRYLCEAQVSEGARQIILAQLSDSDRVKAFYTIIGPKVCRSDGYNSGKLSARLGIISFSQEVLDKAIYYQFKEGQRYSLRDVKTLLSQIYQTVSYKGTPKATDLENYFTLKSCKVTSSDGKRQDGFEIIKRLR